MSASKERAVKISGMADRSHQHRKHQRHVRPPYRRTARPAVAFPPLVALQAALREMPGDLPWERVSELVVPVFERRRPQPFPVELVTTLLPPGVTVGFGIDIGPAFLRVATALLERWPVGVEGLTEQALANLRSRIVSAGPPQLVRRPVEHVPIVALTSEEGWASMLLLVPDQLERIFGSEDRLFVAPMRDLLIGLPPDVDPEFATGLTEEFEARDPDALCLEAFLLRSGLLSCQPLRRGTAIA